MANPEKGFYHGFEIATSSYNQINQTALKLWKNEKVSLVFLHFVLNSFVTSNISTTIIGKMNADFNTLRINGFKSVVRFSYTTVEGNINDATLPQVLKHIDQLKPILMVISILIS